MSHELLLRMARSGFRTGLLLLALSASLVITFGTPDHLKQAVRDSKLYDTAAALLARQAAASSGASADIQSALDAAARQALSPAEVQAGAESIIDGTYHWLDGKTPQPDFHIDLTPVTTQFAAAVGDQAAKHAQSLPVCGLAALRQLDEQHIDLASLPCLPPGITPAAVGQQAAAQAVQASSLLRQPALTAGNLPKTSQGQSYFQAASYLPAMFQVLRLIPWICGALCLLLAAAVFLLYRKGPQAAYDLAKTTAWMGVIILVLGGLCQLTFSVMTHPGSPILQSANGTAEENIVLFVRSIEGVLIRQVLIFGAAYALGGAVLAGLLRLSAGRQARRPLRQAAPASLPGAAPQASGRPTGPVLNQAQAANQAAAAPYAAAPPANQPGSVVAAAPPATGPDRTRQPQPPNPRAGATIGSAYQDIKPPYRER